MQNLVAATSTQVFHWAHSSDSRYKLAPFQRADALANAPKWLRTDRFEIEAEAQGNPTKDQMRLMMQSLLTDRFKWPCTSKPRTFLF